MKEKIMGEFKFNSQVCTSIEQSERLLALGLKKETADMCLDYIEVGWIEEDGVNVGTITQLQPIAHPPVMLREIPAWSLHRLLSMLTAKRKVLLIRVDVDLYDVLIDRIEHEIKGGYFPNEYLV